MSKTSPLAYIPPNPARWSHLRVVLLVLCVAATVRLWFLVSIPLVITNDGWDYLTNAQQFYNRETVVIRSVRTPGYPLFLAGFFHLLGLSPIAVLVANHLLGCLSASVVTSCGYRWGGPRIGLVVGLLFSLDPWILAYESYALTEPLAVALAVIAAAFTLSRPRRWFLPEVGLGLLLGFACLVRPAFQMLVPFFVLARLVSRTPGQHPRAAVAATMLTILGLAIPVLPWLHYNAQRGIHGLACGTGGILWVGMARLGLIQPGYPVDADIREAYASLPVLLDNERSIQHFLDQIDGFASRSPVLGRWALASIRTHPGRYLRACLYALAWQMNWYPTSCTYHYSELAWYLGRLGNDGSNCQYSDDHRALPDFAMTGEGGILRKLLKAGPAAYRWMPGIPQVLLFTAAWLSILLAAVRRDWVVAIIVAGSIAFVVFHALLLQPPSRYSMPAWGMWYVASPMGLRYLVDLLVRRSVKTTILLEPANPGKPEQ